MKTVFLLFLSLLVSAATPWPGEPWQQAQILTSLDDDFGKNLSGAHWNPTTRTLWVCVNAPGKFLALIEDATGSFTVGSTKPAGGLPAPNKVDQRVGQRAEWSPGGDLEGITQVDLAEQSVYVLAEGEDVIRKYATDTNAVRLVQSWNIKPHVPTSGGAGSEGITFVPDAWLAKGNIRVSRRGMGGLMFVAHQNGGGVYAFDLDPASTAVDFVGAYKTARLESSGLELDRSTGRLYVWHNTGTNYLEVSDLSSVVLADGSRQLRQIQEYTSPKAGNLEGFAMTPTSAHEQGAFIVDDDNQDGAALMRFRKFSPDVVAIDVRVSASVDDAEESSTGVVNLVSTDLELTRDTSTQTVGMRFVGVAVPAGARVLRAYVQFGTDEISSVATNLVLRGQALAAAPAFLATTKNISARAKTVASVAWSPNAWTVVGETGAGQRTPDISAVVQEVLAVSGWQAGSAVVILVTGTGKRVAEAYDGDKTRAPLLHVEFEP